MRNRREPSGLPVRTGAQPPASEDHRQADARGQADAHRDGESGACVYRVRVQDPQELGEATEDDLYEAMDWLLQRKERIEKKFAARHLGEGGWVLYDVSSSYYGGHTCPLAQYGHDRDGKKGLPIIVYGAMTNGQGCPVAVSVYAGNTGNPTTVADQIEKLRKKFGLSQVVMVGDRGMLTQPQIDKLKQHPGMDWITALTSTAIRRLVDGRALQLAFFRREESGRDHLAGLPGGAADRMLQPGAGGAAPAARSGSRRTTVPLGTAQEALPSNCRGSAGTQLPQFVPELASRARVTYALKAQKEDTEEKTIPTFHQVPEPTPLQARACELIRLFPVTSK